MASIRDRSLSAALDVARALGESRVVDDPDMLERFAGDESEEPPRAPDAALLPRSADEVARMLAIAAAREAPVTPRAGGTGKSGGAVPVEGGLVLACEKLGDIEEIHEGDLVCVVQPGLVLARLHEAVRDAGLFYPPDPASLDSCCLGGNVAENAGGPRAFKYGVTDHYVLHLEVATAAGDLVGVGHRPVKGVAGYNLAQALVGSEGTLGIFTRITLRLLPDPPEVSTALALFEGAQAAGRGVGAVLAAGLVPRVLEFLDAECVRCVREAGVPLPPGDLCLVLAEFDGSAAAVEADLERGGDALEASGAREVLVATGAVERDRLWRARRDLSEALERSRAHKISDDIAVPRSRLPEVLSGIESIARERGIVGATFGHAGDGNLHVNYLWDDPDLDARGRDARAATWDLALRLGGTVSGEHGIGSLKREPLARELGPRVMQLSRDLKRLFDPRGILNPGKIL